MTDITCKAKCIEDALTALQKAGDDAYDIIKEHMQTVDEVNIDIDADQIYIGDEIVESVESYQNNISISIFNQINGYSEKIYLEDIPKPELLDLALYLAKL